MGKLLLHGPVHVLQTEREMDQYEWGGTECKTSYWFTIFIKEAAGQTHFCRLVVLQDDEMIGCSQGFFFLLQLTVRYHNTEVISLNVVTFEYTTLSWCIEIKN